jgi:tRNASer (uridine44-2'-O)-methyltransferase
MQWCVVRKLVPRNPKLDESLVQSCYLYTSNLRIRDPEDEEKSVPAERYLIIYVPHTDTPDDIPFYHPKCARLAILYTYLPSLSSSPSTSKLAPGTLSLSYTLFPTHPLDTRLIRTSLNLLLITHKHARGRAAGYKKRVHHDVVVPQKQFQDTYVYLKGKYARTLMEGWVESTPAGKHVFEDLGIAAFLIELWVGMYGGSAGRQEIERGVSRLGLEDEDAEREEGERRKERLDTARAKFPGFVDIGCGNGLLVHILNQEGWRGWGFDARTRKSWATFTPEVQANLKEMLLVPEVLQNDDPAASVGGEQEPGTGNSEREPKTHNGVFPTGTFIISNHADELTLWTPLLASLSSSPFIAIPCCSHDFGGSRFRAPFKQPPRAADDAQGKKGKQPSAYASLCSYLEQISRKAGYVPEKEHLRIPSTRNVALLGRSLSAPSLDTDSNSKEKENEEDEFQKRMQKAREIVVEEMPHCDIEQVRLRWLRQGGSLQKEGKGGGH